VGITRGRPGTSSVPASAPKVVTSAIFGGLAAPLRTNIDSSFHVAG
jgi:hypothetical protein